MYTCNVQTESVAENIAPIAEIVQQSLQVSVQTGRIKIMVKQKGVKRIVPR